MKFDLKDMYKFLLSHTFPGLLLGIQVILSLLLFTDLTILSYLQKAWNSSTLLLVILGYAFSTLLGFIVDGIHHLFLEDSMGFTNFMKLRVDAETPSFKEESAYARKKFEAIADSDSMEVYKHFLDDDLWYPYEAYANIGIAMMPGLFLLIYLFVRGLFIRYYPWNFELACSPLVLLVYIIIYSFILWVMLYEAKHTLLVHAKDEEQFYNVFSARNKKKE